MGKIPKSEAATGFGHTIAVIPNDREPDVPEASPSSRMLVSDFKVSQQSFKVRLADTETGRNSASVLINKMYSWRGYAGSHKLQMSPNRITLTASYQDDVIGTATLGIDSSVGLLADAIFKDEIDVYREKNGKVCEIVKLAFDPNIRSKMVLASLFHIIFIYGRRIHQCTDVFIEVNPRHRLFYERMLGFKPQGPMKTNPRVNAPAYLLWVSLDFVEQQIEKYGGTSDNPGATRSLYPYFFSPREEEGIVRRILPLD